MTLTSSTRAELCDGHSVDLYAFEVFVESWEVHRVQGNESESESEVVTKVSPLSVSDTVSRFTELLSSKGVRLFAVIDQAAEARSVGLELRETVLILFGNPVAGTPVMEAAPLAALDLPLRILVWADGTRTAVSYTSPRALSDRHHLSPELADNLASIDGLTDALIVAPR